jgi:hypothetical protein
MHLHVAKDTRSCGESTSPHMMIDQSGGCEEREKPRHVVSKTARFKCSLSNNNIYYFIEEEIYLEPFKYLLADIDMDINPKCRNIRESSPEKGAAFI